MVDVVDSKSTAGDSVPVRVRSPAPSERERHQPLSFALCRRQDENPLDATVQWTVAGRRLDGGHSLILSSPAPAPIPLAQNILLAPQTGTGTFPTQNILFKGRCGHRPLHNKKRGLSALSSLYPLENRPVRPFFTAMISPTIPMDSSSGVSPPRSRPMGECTVSSKARSKPAASSFS